MARSRKLLFSTVLALGVTALGLWTLVVVAEHRIDERLARVRAELGGPVAPFDSRFEVLYARLVALDAYLEQRAPAREGLGAPRTWESSQRAELESGLASLGSFFERADALAEDRSVRDVLESDRFASQGPPRLAASRHRTNVLCAQALVEFEGPSGTTGAAKRLAQALDLIRLGDDGSTVGYLISTANEDHVLLALKRILLDPRADRVALRRELDGRLARIASVGRVEAALARELDDPRLIPLLVASRDRRFLPTCVTNLVEKVRLADAAEEALALARMSGSDSRQWLEGHDGALERAGGWFRTWLHVAGKSHLFRARRDVTRIALEVGSSSNDKREPSGASARPSDIRIDETERRVDIQAEGALAAFGMMPGDPGTELLCWTILR